MLRARHIREEVTQQVSQQQFTTFTVGAEEYGIPILTVREIKGWSETKPLPDSPPHMRGVISLRGLIVPIFDMRARFGHGITECTKTHVVIIVVVTGRLIGILVDTVQDILTVETQNIQPAPQTDRMVDNDYLDGIVMLGERMVSLLSLERLFDVSKVADGTLRAGSGQ